MPKPTRILLADDHPLFREGVALSLGAEPDFEIVAQAGSGEEAVELAQRLRPDMALLDVEMAGMGGVAAAGKISASIPMIRIMMLTVSENRENLLAALKAGAHGYVLKGVSAGELRAITRSVAGGEAYVSPALAADMLTELSRPQSADPLSELTAREAKILKLLSQGLTNKEIGDAMYLAEKTVKHYMTNILQKLHVRSRTEAALIAMQRGISERAP
ncbi:MAG: DNA-binding response regulator [Gallionellales bacterium RIFCSPLOWO2_12_FULL_59_22]|nr:MAG: DNA-binding response regulator [Gallionellales bacterium RIFCSPLOWO2_02_FULL_59_110]OGT01488.1 MAG: DNA-binding response regulator [Gallionellales bacterium RIFCSPLOWO2_02_58_13]OGT14709.1 MAG: DNA-binding response regulator [Gallionellales bacterium RIFCSPLOWO2_12_FULL_59_22]